MITALNLPPHAVEVARQFVEDESRSSMGLGDLINELALELDADVSAICRGLEYEIGASYHTLRDYAYIAGRIPIEARDEYPTLTRHQWKACLSAGDDYLEVAEWAVSRADTNGGRTASVKMIWAHVTGQSEEEYEAEQYLARHVKRVESLLMGMRSDSRLPSWLSELTSEWLGQLSERTSHR